MFGYGDDDDDDDDDDDNGHYCRDHGSYRVPTSPK